jgi:hypothetical protein
MQVSDDGCGMDADEIVGFFKSYGASGKAVGGEHDNMASARRRRCSRGTSRAWS